MVVLHGNTVVARSQAAAADGVVVGMRRRQAQARCPAARVVHHDPGRDARAFEAVAVAVQDVAPRVEVAEPGMVAFMAHGPSRYFGGDEAMIEHVRQVVERSAGAATCTASGGVGGGVADGRFTAMLAARRSAGVNRAVVVPPGDVATADYLARYPVRALSLGGVSEEVIGLLPRLGVVHLGQLAKFQTSLLLARFGWMGPFAQRLAASGDDRPPDVADAAPHWAVQHEFEQPVLHADTAVFAARHLVERLVGVLSDQGRVCTRLMVVAETEHGERSEREWYRPAGLSAASMVERIRWQLDAWVSLAQQHAGQRGNEVASAGITLLRLEPVEVRSDDGVQLGLWGGRTRADEWAQRAVARLASIGEVLVPAGGGGRSPADAWQWVAAGTADLEQPAERMASISGPWPGQLPQPFPAMVYQAPLPIGVLDADGHIVTVSGRGAISAAPAVVGHGSRQHRVARWAGPWPVDERWWDASRARRSARFQLIIDDERLLLVALERQQWWLLAEYR
jgi:protein ImuB